MSEFARYWFAMDDEEFGELTPDRFWSLWKHRQVDFKRKQYVAGIVATMVAAANGAKDVSPMDFVGKSEEEFQYDFFVDKLTALRNKVAEVIPHKLQQARNDALADLLDEGVPNAEQIVSDVFD
jgi:hypothetical protein